MLGQQRFRVKQKRAKRPITLKGYKETPQNCGYNPFVFFFFSEVGL